MKTKPSFFLIRDIREIRGYTFFARRALGQKAGVTPELDWRYYSGRESFSREVAMIAITVLQFILSFAFLLYAAYIAVMNWACVIITLRNKRRGIDRHHSTVPFFSALIIIIALLLYPHPRPMAGQPPVHDPSVWMLIVPCLDIGNLQFPLLPLVLIYQLIKRKTRSP